MTSASRGAWGAVAPYLEKEALAAFFVGVSSGFPYAMIGATLTTRLAQDGIDKATVTAFTLAFLVYNFKVFWAWVVDGVRLPVIGRMGQRVSWMLFSGALVIASVVNLAVVDPSENIPATIIAAVLVGVAGATFDIVIDAYRIETLRPDQLGTGSGMSQYGWRIGAAGAGALALVVAARYGWTAGYVACAAFALPAMLTAIVMGEPARRSVSLLKKDVSDVWQSIAGPFREFLGRHGAWLVLAFILVHKIGDTLANLTFRLLFEDLGFTNDEIAFYDVGLGWGAFMVGIFLGGILYTRLGLKRAVMLALILMAVSNVSFAGLAVLGASNWAMAGAIGFENFASGYGGVVVVAYFSALCDLQFYGGAVCADLGGCECCGADLLTGTTAGGLIEGIGYVNFYLLTTVLALPGIALFWWMMRTGLVDEALGSAGVSAGKAPESPSQPGRG